MLGTLQMTDDLVWAYAMLASFANDDGVLLWAGKQFVLHLDRVFLEIYNEYVWGISTRPLKLHSLQSINQLLHSRLVLLGPIHDPIRLLGLLVYTVSACSDT
jgi:hypothetical protein